MIARLTGSIAYKSIDHVIVDVGGVGYRVLIPLSTFYALPEEGTVSLSIHTHVREDALLLYGFLSEVERELFLLLLHVSGIGPKVALNILSHIPAADLIQALRAGDVRKLSSLPGIGKKTAERMVLELREKLDRVAPEIPTAPTAVSAASDVTLDEAVSALSNLGYKESQARKVVEALEVPPGAALEEILKGALKILVR